MREQVRDLTRTHPGFNHAAAIRNYIRGPDGHPLRRKVEDCELGDWMLHGDFPMALDQSWPVVRIPIREPVDLHQVMMMEAEVPVSCAMKTMEFRWFKVCLDEPLGSMEHIIMWKRTQ